jgi:parallel beta-helix repeat protein
MKKINRRGSLIALALFVIAMMGCKKEEVVNVKENNPDLPKDTLTSTPEKPVIETANYYIATNGDDKNPGTIDKPFKTWGKILNLVKPGDLVYLRGGVYPAVNDNHAVFLKGKNGAPGKYIRFWAYPGEKPILDCSNMTVVNYLCGVDFNGDYWHFKGLEVKNVPQPRRSNGIGYFCDAFSVQNSKNCIFENINTYHNAGIGFYLGENVTNNLILNCDSYDNYDPYSYNSLGEPYDGGNADGFRLSSTTNDAVNTIRGCRSWGNSDDGYDCWGTEGILNIENCQAFRNGYLPETTTPKGDGNGFKFGATYIPANGTYRRIVTNCLSFENRGQGFDQNAAICLMLFENNTAFKNIQFGFYLCYGNVNNKLRNNIAVGNHVTNPAVQISLTANADQTNNSWNGIGADASQFFSLNTDNVMAARNSDGSLKNCDFLKLKQGSIYIDKGVDVGLPYTGKAPDLGAFEKDL